MAREYVAGTYASGQSFNGYFDIDYAALTVTGSVDIFGANGLSEGRFFTPSPSGETTFSIKQNAPSGYTIAVFSAPPGIRTSNSTYDLTFDKADANASQFQGGTYRLTTNFSFQPTQVSETAIVSSQVSPTPIVVCFATGTRIATSRGAVAVEDLRPGDLAVTASGVQRPVRWIGHRTIDAALFADPASVWPIRITAGAVGLGLPARDLLVSPDHCILFDDVLIPAKHLTNGATIRQEPVASVDYWHVELDGHDALMAEGLPAESYRDCGMHAFFGGGRTWGVRAVGAEPAPPCAPHVLSGPRLHAVKAWLIARARMLGAQCYADPALALVADGKPLASISTEGRRFVFDVPEGARDLVLHSRTTLAAHWIADNEDRRQLGVRVSDLRVDGEPVPMTDGRLERGWNPAEPNGAERWTKGAAHLPIGRRVSFEADWFLPYPAEAEAAPPARVANG